MSNCSARGSHLVLAEPETIVGAIDGDTALVLLTHVNFRTGAAHDMAAITAHCSAHGVPVIWDLSHSAGAVPLALNDWGVEYAVGCTYKFLNGGPGAPAYIYVAQDVICGARARGDRLVQPRQPVRLRGPLSPHGRHREVPLVGTFPPSPLLVSARRAVMHGIDVLSTAWR